MGLGFGSPCARSWHKATIGLGANAGTGLKFPARFRPRGENLHVGSADMIRTLMVQAAGAMAFKPPP